MIVLETPTGPKTPREKTTQIMFETFTVPALYVAQELPMSLYSQGKTEGLALTIGHGVTHSCLVYEGF